MGKSNRIRADRAKREVKSLDTKKTKKGMPSWLMSLITIVLTLAILLSVVGLLLSSNGVFNRWAKVVSTEHFKVNANMMSYYFQTQYQSFLSNQSSMLSYFSLDTSKSLKTQQFAPDTSGEEGVFYYDELFLGEYEGTWFDYFMDQTVDSVSSILVFCEAAYERDLALDDAENEVLDANLATLGTTAITYGYATTDAYISAMYGQGVKEKDVRRAMEYSALANKAMTVLSKELSQNITSGEIDEKYNSNPKAYDMIDFSYYTFSVSYNDAKEKAGVSDVATKDLTEEQKTKVADAYKELIAEAKKDADQLLGKVNVEEVNKFILSTIAEKEVDKAWKSKKPATDEKDKQVVLDNEITIKAALVGAIGQEVLAGKTESSKAIETNVIIKDLALEQTTKDKINDIQNTAFKATLTAKETYVRTGSAYAGDDDEFFVWAYEDGRCGGDSKKIVKGDEKAAVSSTSSYSISAYFLAKAPYRDDTKTRNVAYMLFTDEATAKSAIQALMDRNISEVDAFEALADEFGAATHTHLEDYVKGSLNSDVFDTWLFAENLKVGEFTGTPLSLDEATFCVALYYGEGHESWYVTVKNEILTEDFDALTQELNEKYSPVVNEKALNRIDA